MKKDLYNFKDEEYQHVVKLLKELPKEIAPENFEYNLSVKIKNENFDLNYKESKFTIPWKIFVPTAGVFAASFLLFFTMFYNSDSLENPFQIKPQLRNELSSNILKSSKKLGNQSKINKNDVIIRELSSELTPDDEHQNFGNESVVAESEKTKPDFPFNDLNSTNLDEALSDQGNPTRISRRATLAARSSSRSTFNGFYIREEVDKAYVEALKARNDSLKKALRARNK